MLVNDISADYFAQHLSIHPVMGIFRGMAPRETVDLCRRAWEFGVDLVEIPLQDPSAIPSFKAALVAGREADKHIGAGTVTTIDQLNLVQRLGGAFTVSPGLDQEIARASIELGLPHLPGVATSSEIGSAVKLGLNWVKAFPAAQLGPDWIRAQRGPFPAVNFVATGGVGPGNIRKFLAAGCRAVAVGSAFGDEASIARLAGALNESETK